MCKWPDAHQPSFCSASPEPCPWPWRCLQDVPWRIAPSGPCPCTLAPGDQDLVLENGLSTVFNKTKTCKHQYDPRVCKRRWGIDAKFWYFGSCKQITHTLSFSIYLWGDNYITHHPSFRGSSTVVLVHSQGAADAHGTAFSWAVREKRHQWTEFVMCLVYVRHTQIVS